MSQKIHREVPLSDGDPQFGFIMIRGVPHRVEAIRDLEQQVGGTIVRDEAVLANLDKIVQNYITRNKKFPELVQDSLTRDRFVPVRVSIPTAMEGVPMNMTIYLMLPLVMRV